MSGSRAQRVADQLRAELARLLQEEVRDPHVGFVTITDVELSPDLRHARVFISVLGEQEPESLEALRRATAFLRRALARRSNLRFVPELRFAVDRSAAESARLERLFREWHREQESRGDDRTDAPPDKDLL